MPGKIIPKETFDVYCSRFKSRPSQTLELYINLMEANALIIQADGLLNEEFWEECRNVFHLIRKGSDII